MRITKNDISEMEKRYRTCLINSLPGYKSLHLVGTVDPYGTTNLCLFNSVFHIGANPPLLGMVCRPDMPNHDTLSNILATGCYTLNNVLPQWYQHAHQTSANYPSGKSEFELCGFTESFSDKFKAPFVEQSTVKIGMELRRTIDIDINNTTIVIGEIMQVVLDESIIGNDGYIDHGKAGSITVTGLDSYYTTQPLGRLAYAKAGNEAHLLLSDI
jgi:flavin reductase (DIM6/NTAB) family NADH-FMN oxidoreductase RutF